MVLYYRYAWHNEYFIIILFQVIDCARNGNLGCDGGDTCSLLDWLTENRIKIEVEKDYPLKLKTDVCKIKKNISGVEVAPDYSCD